jgi:excisionase family DNA binding protein
MKDNNFLSTTELAKILGISRIAVYRKIKRGKIKAKKIAGNYAINKKDLGGILEKELSKKERKEIEKAVQRVVKEYGETLKLLGQND